MKKIIYTPDAPSPIGPYSQAVEANGMLFVSGQIALDPVSGELIQDDIETETRQVFSNLKAILEARGLTFDHVVKSTVFVADMNQFARINAVYAEYFSGEETPA
ncbi:MAG: Rid family detoxifying hydrolase, partial [Saprospiraceae bacterium]